VNLILCIHHHIVGAYQFRYAQEASWREDNRRVSKGDQAKRLASLLLKQKAFGLFLCVLATSPQYLVVNPYYRWASAQASAPSIW
jgi:hypothetical protein